MRSRKKDYEKSKIEYAMEVILVSLSESWWPCTDALPAYGVPIGQEGPRVTEKMPLLSQERPYYSHFTSPLGKIF